MTPRASSSTVIIPDRADREAALVGINRSFLVEAGAGSGKTSVLAGRIAVLLASGVEPKQIAAITFTEFAASGLTERIRRFVAELAECRVPRDLELAFPAGLSAAQREHLRAAQDKLDQLTCSTIHGFAQSLIKPYPVEASIDPGADIVDPAEAELAFAEQLDLWLRAQLSGESRDNLITELVLADEAAGLNLVHSVAQFRKSNRDARPPAGEWSTGLFGKFDKLMSHYHRRLKGIEFREETTEATLNAFAELEKLLRALNAGSANPSNCDLIAILMLPRPEACFTQSGGPRPLRTKGKWEAAAKAAGHSKPDGVRAHDSANDTYNACHEAFAVLVSAAAGEVLRRLAASLDGLMSSWRDYKRGAALLDFDDLLYTARDLLAGHEEVRQALAARYRHILVDEFQDTDPLQIEILWQLCGEVETGNRKRGKNPIDRRLRPGALFLVGDPKQAIYRFRGADVNAYLAARRSIGANALREITANFRSVKPILEFVNARFAAPLDGSNGQPGFVALDPIVDPISAGLHVAALDVRVDDEKPTAEELRDAEAERVADLCSHLIGHWTIRDPEHGKPRPCEAGDIALLAPVGTDLWRFEEALEELGIPVSTQAGKGFFRRQEVQDLIAITRALADARDTLALGAFLRGPLVGLTEKELLDIAEGLSSDANYPEWLPQLGLWTPIEEIRHELAHSILERLQALARRARSTTPYLLLADAVEQFNVRAQLRQRFRASAERALANVDLYLEMARAYDVRGLRGFARDMRGNWEEAARQVEGRPDAERQAVALLTVHAAKGLEWPIVIPVNTSGRTQGGSGIVHDRAAARFSTPVFGIEPAGHADLKSREETEQDRERVRLWYVASTRARDLLVLPRHSAQLPDNSWAKAVNLELEKLPALDPKKLPASSATTQNLAKNPQTREIFAREEERIANATRSVAWLAPSRSEAAAAAAREPPAIATSTSAVEETVTSAPLEVAGSATRGTILHKLMEEVLNGEIVDDTASLSARANELMAQLEIAPADDARTGIVPAELAETVARTLSLPEIVALRPRLIPEMTVYGHEQSPQGELLVAGVADAVALDADGKIEIVIDWKSDVAADPARVKAYRTQVEAYRRASGATRGLLVLMSTGTVVQLGDC